MNVTLSKWHRKMCKPGNRLGWTIEDSFQSLADTLHDAGLISKDNPEVEQAVIKAWVKMASASYLPYRLRNEINLHLDEDCIITLPKKRRQPPMRLDLSNLMGN